MAKNSSAGQPDTPGALGPQRRQSRLGLAALVLAVLALPAALFPWLGLLVSMVVLVVGLIALILAMRSPNQGRAYPMIAVAVSIVAVALAGVVTNNTVQAMDDCGEAASNEELLDCMDERRGQ